jgi:hypothetical protein
LEQEKTFTFISCVEIIMKEAIRVYSQGQFFVERIKAIEIKSRADARKLGPFISDDEHLVTWVDWALVHSTNKKRKPHFRRFPKKSQTPQKIVSEEIKLRYKSSLESKKHIKAKEVVADIIQKLLECKRHLHWAYKDTRLSDFSISGDLLAEVECIETEFPIKTPFGTYRLDIALLGPIIEHERVVLAGIEIEYTHQFEFSKALVCKTLGFPLMSLDIKEIDIEEINTTWATSALIETKNNSNDGLRRNYIYVHDMLFPVYLNIPDHLCQEKRHQYIIFCRDENFSNFLLRIRQLVSLVGLNESSINIAPVKIKNEQTKKQIMNAGLIAGENWREYNEQGFIQVSVDKPIGKAGPSYLFHLELTKLSNSIYSSLVGYKYKLGLVHIPNEPSFWEITERVNQEIKRYKVAPKRVSEPVAEILKRVSELN